LKKVYIYLFFIQVILANDVSFNKLIPKNYQLFYKSENAFNKNGINDIVLNLINKKTAQTKLLLLNQKNNAYTIIMDSNNSISYPSNNGEGRMVQNIYADFNKDKISIHANEYSGISNEYTFIFNFRKGSFYLEKYFGTYGNYCNNYSVTKIFTINNFPSNVLLEDFSIELFFEKYAYMAKREVLNEFMSSFNEIKKLYSQPNKEKFKKYIRNNLIIYTEENVVCKRYDYLEMYLYLDNINMISKSNDIAYYFQKAGANKEAIYLLEKILEKFPERTVAYYNLGDAYWELGEKKKAIKAYGTYIEQMKAKGKDGKIPKVVLDRVENYSKVL